MVMDFVLVLHKCCGSKFVMFLVTTKPAYVKVSDFTSRYLQRNLKKSGLLDLASI